MKSEDAVRERIEALRDKARVLYEGKLVAHRSCGIALAATFLLPTKPYQALRRGGLSGEGACGAVQAGRLILGELLGDPDPTGAATEALRQAIAHYDAEIARRMPGAERATCNALVGGFPVFEAEERVLFCAGIEALVAEVVAETLHRFGVKLPEATLPER